MDDQTLAELDIRFNFEQSASIAVRLVVICFSASQRKTNQRLTLRSLPAMTGYGRRVCVSAVKII